MLWNRGCSFTESDNDREFLYTPTLKISQQAFSAVFDRICIAIEPIKAGKVGLVAVAGICIAEVDCTNPGRYAHLPTSAGANLVAGGFGSIHILHRPAGTGLKNCLVRFDRMSNVYCKTQSSIAAASSGTSPTSGTVDVCPLGMDLPFLTVVLILRSIIFRLMDRLALRSSFSASQSTKSSAIDWESWPDAMQAEFTWQSLLFTLYQLHWYNIEVELFHLLEPGQRLLQMMIRQLSCLSNTRNFHIRQQCDERTASWNISNTFRRTTMLSISSPGWFILPNADLQQCAIRKTLLELEKTRVKIYAREWYQVDASFGAVRMGSGTRISAGLRTIWKVEFVSRRCQFTTVGTYATQFCRLQSLTRKCEFGAPNATYEEPAGVFGRSAKGEVIRNLNFFDDIAGSESCTPTVCGELTHRSTTSERWFYNYGIFGELVLVDTETEIPSSNGRRMLTVQRLLAISLQQAIPFH